MYMFSRTARIHNAEGLEWATRIRAKAADVSGTHIDLWGTVWSPGYGTIAWTTWVESLAALESMGDAFQADEGYNTLAGEGGAHTGGVFDDSLIQLISGTPSVDRELTYATGVTAVCAAGNIERAMGLGVEIAEMATKLTGVPTLFLRGMTGPYAGVGWLTGHENVKELEAAQDALAASADWIKLVDSTEGAFAEEPQLTQQTVYRKLG